MAKNKALIKADFYCVECGKLGIPIARTVRQQREPGHLKRLYCLHCKKETNHAEIREKVASYTYFDFKMEYDLGRFVDGNRIAIADLDSCKNHDCECNVHGKCWNANKTVKCEERENG